MNFGNIIENILNKNFSQDDVDNYLGVHLNAYSAYSKDSEIRNGAASGGVVSSMLIKLLELNLIDGALVCYTNVKNNHVRIHFKIATTREEILDARGSKYVETKFSTQAIPLIREFNGRIAVVGLPCDLTILKNKANMDKKLSESIAFTIALVCGHNSRKELVDTITNKLTSKYSLDLKSYKFREGHWRGNLIAEFENNKIIKKPFSYFSIYQNLFFFSEKKCLYCNDHFGYDSDISIGDIWSYKNKINKIKKNGILTKTRLGQQVVDNVLLTNILNIESLNPIDIVDGQKRSAPFHYNISARAKVGRIFGLNIPDKSKLKVKWYEYLTAFIVLFNWKWSTSKKYKKYIFIIPKPLLKIYLYIFKGLESLK